MKATAARREAKRKRDVGPRSRRALERLRMICLALPEMTEKTAWGEPTFRVRGKLFAQFDDHHHGADHVAVWLAMPLGAQEGLVYVEPARFFVPPYVGRRGWVGVRLDRRPNWSAIGDLVREAYRTVAPRRLAEALPPARTGGGAGGRRDDRAVAVPAGAARVSRSGARDRSRRWRPLPRSRR